MSFTSVLSLRHLLSDPSHITLYLLYYIVSGNFAIEYSLKMSSKLEAVTVDELKCWAYQRRQSFHTSLEESTRYPPELYS